MSMYNPDFFKPNRPSEKIMNQVSNILEDLDPKLKDQFLKDMQQELASSKDHFDLSKLDLKS